MEIFPIGPEIGSDVVGCDLREMDDAGFRQIAELLGDRLMLRFPKQDLDDGDQLALTARFGPLDDIPRVLLGGMPRDERFPALETVSNVVENGRLIGSLGYSELTWHSDIPFMERPYGICILRAVEVPPAGGDFHFANMYAALETLDADLRGRIEGLTVLQDGTVKRSGRQRLDLMEEAEAGAKLKAVAVHPLVRTHPDSGRRFLYLGRLQNARILELTEDDSAELLDRLWRHATAPQHCCTGRWRVGDVIIWDNRCTLHRRDGFSNDDRRILRRTSVRGERPYI